MKKQLFFGMSISTLLLIILVTTFFNNLVAIRAASAWPIYISGSSDENVRTIQYMLRHQGYNLSVNGKFDSVTASTVKRFQSKSDLTADGIVDAQTWEKLIVTTSIGSTGNAVIALQRQLNAQSSHLVIDGIFGLATAAAVKNFQRNNGLSADGIASLQTWNKLVSDSFALASPGKLPNPTFGAKIEDYAIYVGQSHCDPVAKPGVIAFRDLVLKAFPGTRDDGITRQCNIGGQSEHKEGRAWDWAVSALNANDVAIVNQAFAWLFATDPYGHPDAMIRRLGIMYIVWNHHIWSASIPAYGWQPYHGPNPHTDHVHFSFSWDGAYMKTSFWHPSNSF